MEPLGVDPALAQLIARGIEFSGAKPLAKAQTGSVVEIDGEAVDTEDIDVAALYESVMRKDAPR